MTFPVISHPRSSRRDHFGRETEGITAQLTPNQGEKFILFMDQLNLAVLGFGMWPRAGGHWEKPGSKLLMVPARLWVHPGSSWVWECECHIQQNKWNHGIIKIGKKPPGLRCKHRSSQEGIELGLIPGNAVLSPDLHSEGVELCLISGNAVLSPDLHSEPRNGHRISPGPPCQQH